MNYLRTIEFSIRYPRRWQAFEDVACVVEDIQKMKSLTVIEDTRLTDIYEELKLTSDYFNMWNNHMSESGYQKFALVCLKLHRFIKYELGTSSILWTDYIHK